MNPNDADGMANSVDPDLGPLYCPYLSENLGSLRYVFWGQPFKSDLNYINKAPE